MAEHCESIDFSDDDDWVEKLEKLGTIKDCSRRVMDCEMSSNINVKGNSGDGITDLINLQKANGAFELSSENWVGSVLEEYLGSYSDVKSNCPPGIEMNLWITALSMKILEIEMGDKKDLWDLVMRKSHRFLNQKLKGNLEILIDQAEKYVKKK